jgi:hypothetical protein
LPSTIEQVHREFAPRGLAVLAVNIQEEPNHVAGWIREKKVSAPVLLDRDGGVTAAYRVTGTPTVVLIDRGGKMVGRAVGTRGWTTTAGSALLKALLEPPRR